MTLFVSRRLRRNLADVRHGISLLHGRDRTNIEHHACGGRPSLRDGVSEVVRHVPDFHALLHIRAALDRGIKNPVPIADHRIDFGDPYGVLNGGRLTGQHFEVAHYVERSIGQRLNVVCFHGAGVAGLHGNGRFAARARGTVEITGGVGIRRAVGHDNNVVQPKGQHHVMSNGVLFLIPGLGPVAVGPQVLVQVSAVVINQVVAALHDLLRNQPRCALGLCAVLFAGIKAVHALPVHRVHVRDLLQKRLNIDQGQDDHRAGNLRRVERLNQFLHGDDRGVFRPMGAGHQRQHRPRLRALNHGNGNACRRVHSGRDFDEARGLLPGPSRRRADCKASSLRLCGGPHAQHSHKNGRFLQNKSAHFFSSSARSGSRRSIRLSGRRPARGIVKNFSSARAQIFLALRDELCILRLRACSGIVRKSGGRLRRTPQKLSSVPVTTRFPAQAFSSSKKKLAKLTLWPLVAATFFMVSGGTYGTEDIIHGAGYGRGILILLLTPLLWSLPTAFMIGELSSALPAEGGYYVWVRRAMGRFWGFQEAWLSLVASIFDTAIYPTLFVAYLTRLLPW